MKLLFLVFIFSLTSNISQELWNKTDENRISTLAKLDFVKFKYQLILIVK